MIAMQYSFALPSDYDMDIIAHRIADKGHFTDALPGLIFKAYLSADKNTKPANSQDNLYAPFYLWEDSDAIVDRFLLQRHVCRINAGIRLARSENLVGVGQPLGQQLANARFATRETSVITPHVSLRALRNAKTPACKQWTATTARSPRSAPTSRPAGPCCASIYGKTTNRSSRKTVCRRMESGHIVDATEIGTPASKKNAAGWLRRCFR